MKKEKIEISGVSLSRSAFVISEKIIQNKGRSLVITATDPAAKDMAGDLHFFTGKPICLLPSDPGFLLNFEARNRDELGAWLKSLKLIETDSDVIVVAGATSVIKRLVPHEFFYGSVIGLRIGENADPESLRKKLVDIGYERVSMVESRGEFSVRGGILDVFPPDLDIPQRIEFFDNEVDSIRTFSPDDQRSISNIKETVIRPAERMPVTAKILERGASNISRAYSDQINKLSVCGMDSEEIVKKLSDRRDRLVAYAENGENIQLLENYIKYFFDDTQFLWDYMDDCHIYLDDLARIEDVIEAASAEKMTDFENYIEEGQVIPDDASMITGMRELRKAYDKESVFFIKPISGMIGDDGNYTDIINENGRQIASFNGRMNLLSDELKRFAHADYEIHITASTEDVLCNLKDFVFEEGITGVSFHLGRLSSGLDFPDRHLCYISDADIFDKKKKRLRRRVRTDEGTALQSYAELNRGDYVVHEMHGIGRFLGIQSLKSDDDIKDYLKIQYAGSALLYVPVEQMDAVRKYIGSEGSAPRINKLSGNEWKTTKARAKAAVDEMSQELARLYAERKMHKGYAFSEDTVWQKEFEDSFPYEETDDQIQAAEEIKADMEDIRPMDRLLCGDVGFGKTEVAARAIFKCLADGKQAAMLAPTTILVNQHYHTLKERLADYPFNVEMLSRFRSSEAQRRIVEKLKSGGLDLVIGTHRLLSPDVSFKDLGLLVVDEEQRFGVAHKEKIKNIKKNIDVLTLSATPIPRTLNMSLTGIKNMSMITEPPQERYPVQTYVMESDDSLVKEAISRELRRGGQVFVVYNRINGIRKLAARISELVPEAEIAVGHGRMNEKQLEDVMLDFIDGRTDILVSTAIIESGIDIPNANTLIIMDADRYGLAQLYQLRGRVGRSNKVACAYLMYKKDKVLTEVSEKRLKAIKEFTEFGSGFRIAMKDMELRGAGNLLGSEQSGHMMSIGYELYCKMVNEAIAAIKGEKFTPMADEETMIELNAAANIPDWYIGDESVKLDIYRKIATVKTSEDQSEIIDELTDRFGNVPKQTLALIKISMIHGLAQEVGIIKIDERKVQTYDLKNGKAGLGINVNFRFVEENMLTPKSTADIYAEFGDRVMVKGVNPPVITLITDRRKKIDNTLKLLMIMEGAGE